MLIDFKFVKYFIYVLLSTLENTNVQCTMFTEPSTCTKFTSTKIDYSFIIERCQGVNNFGFETFKVS